MGSHHAQEVTAVAAAAVIAILMSAIPAAAGGTWLEFATDEVAPGDVVHGRATVHRGTQAWVEDGPFHARLRADDAARASAGRPIVGEVALTDETSQSVVAEVRFVLPGLTPGEWWVDVCNADCEDGIGDLIGGTLTVVAPSTTSGPPGRLPRTGGEPLLATALAIGLLLTGSMMLRRLRSDGPRHTVARPGSVS